MSSPLEKVIAYQGETVAAALEFGVAVQEVVVASDSVLGRLLWELINDSQSVTWQNVQSAGATGWVVVNTSETTNWQRIPTKS